MDVEEEEEWVEGDIVVRRSCLAPRGTGDDCLSLNILQSICTIGGNFCCFIIDYWSCDSVTIERHPKPYK